MTASEPQSESGGSVLIVDDTVANRELFSYWFRAEGFDVAVAENGADALAVAAEQRPDLVLLDVCLPDISGFDVCRRLRADPSTAGIAVLQTSASATLVQDKVDGLDGGADAYVTLPVEPDEMIAVAKALIRTHRAEGRAQSGEQRWQQFLAGAVVQEVEKERKALAAELHDEALQQLAGLVFRIDHEKARVANGGGGSVELLDSVAQDLCEISASLRRLMCDLRPPALDERGFLRALHDLVERFGEETGVASSLYTDAGVARLPSHLETTVFRLVQEALTNVDKHAHAATVHAELTRRGDEVVLCVRDDGEGFDFDDRRTTPTGEHWGLLGMRDRVERLGGEWDVETAPGAGTTLRATFPLRRATDP